MSDQARTIDLDGEMEQYTNTEMIVSEDVLEKAKQLAQLISTSEEVRMFQQAEAKVTQHAEVQAIIKKIKKKQKELVAFETTFKNAAMVAKIEAEMDEMTEELDNYPVVTEFKQMQEDINYLLQLVFSVIRDTVSEKIKVESGIDEPYDTCSD